MYIISLCGLALTLRRGEQGTVNHYIQVLLGDLEDVVRQKAPNDVPGIRERLLHIGVQDCIVIVC